MNTEQRRIRKIIRERKIARLDPDNNPFPDVPAGHSRRGALTAQKLSLKKVKRTLKEAVAIRGKLAQEELSEISRRSQKSLTYALTKPREVEGYVTLTQLAAERGMQAQLARIWVKKAKIEQSADGWRWKAGSRELKRVRKILGLPV